MSGNSGRFKGGEDHRVQPVTTCNRLFVITICDLKCRLVTNCNQLKILNQSRSESEEIIGYCIINLLYNELCQHCRHNLNVVKPESNCNYMRDMRYLGCGAFFAIIYNINRDPPVNTAAGEHPSRLHIFRTPSGKSHETPSGKSWDIHNSRLPDLRSFILVRIKYYTYCRCRQADPISISFWNSSPICRRRSHSDL